MRNIELQTLPIWQDEELIGFHGTIVDITQRVKFEEELKEKTEFLDAVVKHSYDGIFVIDEDFNYKFINPASGRITGHKSEDWVGKRAGTNRHPDDEKISLEAVFKALSGEPSTCEVRVMHSSGEYRLLEMRYSLMMIGDDAHILGMVNDISEKKKVENALRESENRLNIIFEFAPDAFYINDFEGNFIDGNKAAEELLGYPRKELIGMNFVDAGILSMEDVEKASHLLAKNINGKLTGPDEYTLKRKDGTKVDVEIIAHPVKIGGEDRVLGIARDVTEKKKAEDALVASEEKYRNIVELSPDGIITINKTGKILSVNKSFCALTGFSEKDYLGINISKIPTKPKTSLGNIMKLIPKVFKGKDLGTIKFKWTHKNGENRDGEARTKKMGKDDDAYIQVVVRDITDEKKAEIALAASEEKYRSLFEHSPEAIVIIDLEGKIVECNNATVGLIELKLDKIIGYRFDELGIIDSTKVIQYVNMLQPIAKGQNLDANEVELIMKNDRSKWIEVFPSLISQSGKPTGIQIIARDITDRKLAEIELHKKLMKFELEEGNIYLSKESRTNQSIEAFKELLMFGHSGILISRRSKKDFQNNNEYMFNHVKISELDKDNHVPPKYNAIHDLLTSLPRGEVVHIDCIEYLITRIGSKKTLNIIQYLKDLAVSKNLYVLISVDPIAISKVDMRLIEIESKNILPSKSLARLSPKLIDALAYIDKLNKEGIMPSYSDIGEYFQLSKPTARHRIRELEELGTVKEIQRGRMKILELTDKGKNYLAV